jgi:hypothetical protein
LCSFSAILWCFAHPPDRPIRNQPTNSSLYVFRRVRWCQVHLMVGNVDTADAEIVVGAGSTLLNAAAVHAVAALRKEEQSAVPAQVGRVLGPDVSQAAAPPYSGANVANRTIRVWHGRQKMVLERGTNPKRSRRTCTCVCTSYNSGEGNRRASRNSRVSSSPTRNPYPAQVWAAVPYYGAYKISTEFFQSRLYEWAASTPEANASHAVIEFVTSPNNPDGALRRPTVPGATVVYDRCEALSLSGCERERWLTRGGGNALAFYRYL